MAPDPAQLLEHARREIPSYAGAPRQADLRRCASTAYYAVFHALCSAVATEFANHAGRGYSLFYRAPEHGKAKKRCQQLARMPLPRPEQRFFGRTQFHAALVDFAEIFSDLQELRHSCDYDPDFRLSKQTAQDAVLRAAQAIEQLQNAPSQEKREFLAFILFDLRQ